jgi:predicted DsbA family dithiol-disulfide isomerase
MKIEIWSDIVCPFCYIGKRHLEQALKNTGKQVEIEWKSFQLDPTVTREDAGASVVEHLAAKKGMSVEQVNGMMNHVETMATNAGLDMKLRSSFVMNTFHAHRVLHFAKSIGKGAELKEAFLNAHFTDNLNLNEDENLIQVAVSVGLNEEDVLRVLHSNEFEEAVNEDAYTAQQFGARGVPFFVFNRESAVSGAQPVEVFEQILNESK